MDERTAVKLIGEALKARKTAYMPYSHYAVGAAVFTGDGRIFGGCNVENASFGATNCAERTAIFTAVCSGARSITALAVIGGPEDEEEVMSGEAVPCGICRQVLREFSDPSACDVIIAKSITNYRITKLENLLPDSFGPDQLGNNTKTAGAERARCL